VGEGGCKVEDVDVSLLAFIHPAGNGSAARSEEGGKERERVHGVGGGVRLPSHSIRSRQKLGDTLARRSRVM